VVERTSDLRSVISVVRGRAALVRFVIVLRIAAIATLIAGAALVTHAPARLAAAGLLAVLLSVGQVWLLAVRPDTVEHPMLFVLVDLAGGAAVFVLTRADPVYYAFTCTSAAVAGALFGLRAAPLWAGQMVAGYLVVSAVLRAEAVPDSLATHLTGIPALFVLAGVAASAARTAVTRQVELAQTALKAIERSAIASERGRMARELHDSVAQTLRGLSFAAFALPESVRRRPELADELAGTVARAARIAADETREVLDGLRTDGADTPFVTVVEETCARWSARTGIPVRTVLDDVEGDRDVEMEVRHELVRILREALSNVDRHAGASAVQVRLTGSEAGLVLVVLDDGAGFNAPFDLRALAALGHYGLVGMAERAARVAGDLRVLSQPGCGTEVAVRVPLGVPPIAAAGR
jgi:signal transduction histidine kinase